MENLALKKKKKGDEECDHNFKWLHDSCWLCTECGKSIIRGIDEKLTVSYDPNAFVILKRADSSKNTAKLFLKWRKENAIYFETIFKGTIEKTQQWIKENTTDKKMLFSILHNSELIGHVGLIRYNKHNNSIMVTNVLRGKRGFTKGLMEAVLQKSLESSRPPFRCPHCSQII